MRPDLVDLNTAADELGVPKMGLRRAAERLGLLVRIGRAVKIDRNQYEELVRGCQEKPQEPVSISAQTRAFSSSAIPATPSVQQAQEIAEMLKKRSRPTSPTKAPSPVQVIPLNSR